MSTVGSASATGSAAGRTTTWASGSAKAEDDEMSVETNFRDIDERDRYSQSAQDEDMDGMSDDASLVGFGEGAGSTVSGPTYSRSNLQKSGLVNQLHREGSGLGNNSGGGGGGGGAEAAERILRERQAQLEDGEQRRPPMGTPDEAGLGKFSFEEGKK